AAPTLPAVGTGPDFSPGRAEIYARACVNVSAHGLTQHREPGLRPRQPAIHAPPAGATIAGAVDRRPAADGGARPHALAVHGQYPRRVGIGRMQPDREADIAKLICDGFVDEHNMPQCAL